MEIFNKSESALDCAMRRFVRQKSDDPVYIYRVNVTRREMWAVLSTAEVKDNLVSKKNFYMKVDGKYGLLEHKRRLEQCKPDTKTRLLIAEAKGYIKYIKAREKLSKMGRDAEGVERPPEVTSDSGPLTDPSC